MAVKRLILVLLLVFFGASCRKTKSDSSKDFASRKEAAAEAVKGAETKAASDSRPVVVRATAEGEIPAGSLEGGGGEGGAEAADGGPVVGMGGLSSEVIVRVIRSRIQRFKFCYEKSLLADPNLSAKGTIAFTITPSGRVTDARFEAGGQLDEKFQECLLGVVRRLVFPAPMGGGQVQVRYPLVFQAAR